MVHKKEENVHDSSSGHIQRRVDNLPARVGPGSKLEVALLVVKGEPGDVDLARRLERIGMMSMITKTQSQMDVALDGMGISGWGEI